MSFLRFSASALWMLLVVILTALSQVVFQPRWSAIFASVLAIGTLVGVSSAAAPDFGRDVLPILSNSCFTCHGPDEAAREADLRLDTEEDAKEWAIVPGDVEGSEIVARMISDDADLRMPPPESSQSISEEEIEVLKAWIAAGAPWGKHWAFQPPERPDVPEVKRADWPETPLDNFVLRRLEELSLEPTPQATKPALLRRVSLDLTGLPPTLEELDAFLADNSPNAYEKAVERLLASPRYGEHMAHSWLAAARYADTNGYQNDATRTMWPWRDWVIRAMNDNMPFDEFTVNQIAGDQLPSPTRDQLLATGFHRNHGLNGEGGRNPEESRVEYVMDRTETTGTVWLGLTLGCSRCHDHKYDPLPQKDFYRLYAFFNSIDERGGVDAGGNAKPVMPLPTEEEKAEQDSREQQIAQLKADRKALKSASPRELENWEAETKAWLARSHEGRLWELLNDPKFESRRGSVGEVLADGSIRVVDPLHPNDHFKTTALVEAGKYYGIRLEIVRDEQLPGLGFSSGKSGRYTLTEIKVHVDGAKAELSGGVSNLPGDKAAKLATDGKTNTNWSPKEVPQGVEVISVVAQFAKPVSVADSGTIQVELRHESRDAAAVPVGRFRVSLTEYPYPTDDEQLNLSRDTLDALAVDEASRTDLQQKLLVEASFSAERQSLQSEIITIQSQLEHLKQGMLKTMVMRDRREPRKTYRLERGLWNQPDKSELLLPDVPECLPPLPEDVAANRLALANWLVDDGNPLVARVIVNRYWHHFFGRGLVNTSEDFGLQGERPSHPDLLDWLATEFVRSGWDVKAMHKLIVTSATYRQSSQVSEASLAADPVNKWLSRGPRFRLAAQAIRDQALAVSGLLVEKRGGKGVLPYQPDKVWSDFSLGKIKYKQGKGDDLYRRSVYTFWRRPVGPTMYFDNPGRQVCTVRPSITNTPLHALTTLNDVTYVEAARVLAEKLLKDEDLLDASQRIRQGFRMATAREPREVELKNFAQLYQTLKVEFRGDAAAAKDLASVGEWPSDETLDTVEIAAMTSVMNAILNLDEVLTKG